jgi:hypothetical protein
MALPEAEERTGEMDEGGVGLGQLLPTHQETAGAIEPTVETLDDPAAWSLERIGGSGVGAVLAAWTDVGHIAALLSGAAQRRSSAA